MKVGWILLFAFLLSASVIADLTPSESEQLVESRSEAFQSDTLSLSVVDAPSLNENGEKVNASTTQSAEVSDLTHKRDVEAIEIISNGGTNSGTALTNGKLVYSASGAIVEAPYLKSVDGKALTISDSGAASVSPIAAVKLNLIGVDSSLTSGPHINTYTSSDNYPLTQQLSFSHNNEAISFDLYWDGVTWKSSHSGSNFQIYKQYNQLQFRYASGIAVGSAVYPSNAFVIDITGKISFSQPIRLPTLSGTASDLNYVGEFSASCSVNTSDGSYTLSSVTIKGQRTGNKVTMLIPRFSGTLSTFPAYILINPSCIPSDFLPSASNTWPMSIYNGDDLTGFLEWDGTTLRLRTDSYSVFSVGSNRGVVADTIISYVK